MSRAFTALPLENILAKEKKQKQKKKRAGFARYETAVHSAYQSSSSRFTKRASGTRAGRVGRGRGRGGKHR
jgi:hypothetical protein